MIRSLIESSRNYPGRPVSQATENIALAWQKVKSNRSAPGIDGVSIEDFFTIPANVGRRYALPFLEEAIHPKPLKRVEIEKPDSGVRLLGIHSFFT